MNDPAATARKNLAGLEANPYPGRGVVVGLDRKGKNMVQIYWIMGRSENSRNRVLSHDNGGRIFTDFADPSKGGDPSLIIYNAMLGGNGLHIVSNGDQTDTVMDSMPYQGGSFERSLEGRTYEPDGPNFTSRITGFCQINSAQRWQCRSGLAILRKSPWSGACQREFYHYADMGDGFGYGVTTYSGDGNPLPSFSAKPLLLPIMDNIHAVTAEYWDILNPENRVALAVKFIPLDGGTPVTEIRNKYEKVASKA